MGKKRGLILESNFLKYLSQVIFCEDHYIKKDYENCIDFFEKVLEQKLEEKDRETIKKYLSGFKQKHQSRVNFWEEMEKPYKRREGNGRT